MNEEEMEEVRHHLTTVLENLDDLIDDLGGRESQLAARVRTRLIADYETLDDVLVTYFQPTK